ncbi:co-chaperone protein HscB [Volucribacter psittacicida]|uniref:Co-chaperone protein HscB homolog n=1 Tax=Volucribacter psittacicida TaxID=203482 RepID=A0A4R1FT98_9PAST|nr:Fe-S protein assembly co-chaperone HscB [Volucribacter psittacicida]TCJ98466.1 co-chaperone protein HscB [Volucribacter psittacicida]
MQNCFQLFELPVSFQLDLNLLSQRYLALQKSLHPDNFASKDEQQQREALQRSSQINDAYQQLKDPILRAEAIVEIATGQAIDKENTTHDMAFLMEQMAWREQLEEIEQSQNEQDLLSLQQGLQEKKSQELTALATEIEQQQWQQSQLHIDRLKFIKKLEQEIERIEDQLAGF